MRQGFTLIQISILLLLSSLVLVSILPSTRTRVTNDSLTTTKLNAALLALRQYQAANGTLPCPADASQSTGANSYGKAAANPGASGNCTGGTPAANYADTTNHVAIGLLPVRALGLSNDYALDAYGRDITYAVDTNATACWASNSLPGQITVIDNGVASNTIAALISHGTDGHGAWIPLTGSSGSAVRLNAGSMDADQLTNAHVNASFAPTTPLINFVRELPTNTFDDLVVYKNPLWTLNNLPQSIPRITVVTPPANGTYTTGQTLSFTVTYSSPVTVNTGGGTPYLSLSAINGSIGTGNLAQATYQSGSGTTGLTFRYTVVSTDSAPTGLTLTSTVTLNGGTIQSGSACALLGLSAPDLSQVIIGGQFIYVNDYGNNRIEKFDSNGNYLLQFGASSSGNGPYATAIDTSGNVWVADTYGQVVKKFDSSGNLLLSFGSSGSGNGQFQYPSGIAVDPSGSVWVTELMGNRVQKFDGNGNFLLKFGSSGSGNGQFNAPYGIVADASGNVWVADYNNYRVQKFNSSGVYQTQFGSSGSGNGQFSYPLYVAIDSSGNIWVTDDYNYRVQEFNSSGAYLGQLGSYGSGSGQFGTPAGIAIDSSGNIWVTDYANGLVEKFSGSGAYLGQFGSSGGGNGQLNHPLGISTGR